MIRLSSMYQIINGLTDNGYSGYVGTGSEPSTVLDKAIRKVAESSSEMSLSEISALQSKVTRYHDLYQEWQNKYFDYTTGEVTMNKKQWKAKFRELRLEKSDALGKSNGEWLEFYLRVSKSIFAGSVFHNQHNTWQHPKLSVGHSPSIFIKCNMQLPANHRGHLA